MNELEDFMQIAIDEAYKGMDAGHGGPFGAIIVKNNEIIGRGHNQVILKNDCTAHAEVTAIRDACKKVHHFDLSGSTLYVNGLPCPMCMGAIFWSRIDCTYYACKPEDAHAIGFDDDNFYRELAKRPDNRTKPFIYIPQMHEKARQCYQAWLSKEDRVPY